ncbi:MAG: hypothetical protein ACEY3J_00825 [Arsenophonus sp.]
MRKKNNIYIKRYQLFDNKTTYYSCFYATKAAMGFHKNLIDNKDIFNLDTYN